MQKFVEEDALFASRFMLAALPSRTMRRQRRRLLLLLLLLGAGAAERGPRLPGKKEMSLESKGHRRERAQQPQQEGGGEQQIRIIYETERKKRKTPKCPAVGPHTTQPRWRGACAFLPFLRPL
jgi:hypothetical protein